MKTPDAPDVPMTYRQWLAGMIANNLGWTAEAEAAGQVAPRIVRLTDQIIDEFDEADARKQRDQLRAEQNGQRKQPIGRDRGKAAKQRDQAEA